MPAKSYIDLPQYNGDFRSMPAYVNAETWDAAAVKWVNVHLDNPRDHDLPTVLGTLIYSDPETAFPLAVMDGTVLTRLRTGAAAAVATDHLAVADADSLGLVGAGTRRTRNWTLYRRPEHRDGVVAAGHGATAALSTRSPTGSTCGRAALRTPPAVMCCRRLRPSSRLSSTGSGSASAHTSTPSGPTPPARRTHRTQSSTRNSSSTTTSSDPLR